MVRDEDLAIAKAKASLGETLKLLKASWKLKIVKGSDGLGVGEAGKFN